MKTNSEEKQKNLWYWLYCCYSALFLIILMFFYNTIDMDYWARVLQGNAFWQTGHILKQDQTKSLQLITPYLTGFLKMLTLVYKKRIIFYLLEI